MLFVGLASLAAIVIGLSAVSIARFVNSRLSMTDEQLDEIFGEDK